MQPDSRCCSAPCPKARFASRDAGPRDDSNMLPRFLEIGIGTANIAASLDFYRRLGFAQISVSDTWPHAYAVVTDGRAFIGLHQHTAPFALTFVVPELAQRLNALEELGMDFSERRLSADEFNQVRAADPDGLCLHLVEARTFSPPLLQAGFASLCGYFSEVALPTRDFEARRLFWEKFGFIGMEEESLPFPRQSLTSDLINLAFYRTRAGREPWLVFEEPDMRQRLRQLQERGFELSDEMPDALDVADNAVLLAPEGTRLLLMTAPV